MRKGSNKLNDTNKIYASISFSLPKTSLVLKVCPLLIGRLSSQMLRRALFQGLRIALFDGRRLMLSTEPSLIDTSSTCSTRCDTAERDSPGTLSESSWTTIANYRRRLGRCGNWRFWIYLCLLTLLFFSGQSGKCTGLEIVLIAFIQSIVVCR